MRTMLTPGAPAPPAAIGGWRLAGIALLPALFVLCLYWPVRNGGWLSDELPLAAYVLEPGPDGLQVSWSRVAADFTGPWAFFRGGYYRPLVTLSLVLDRWLAGDAEWFLHWTSIALLAAAVFAVAWLLGVLFGPVAALLGGLLFAAHPAVHEPVCWPCTRADFMVVIAMACACSSFVRHLRGEPGRHLLRAHLAFAIALLAKETGLWTIVWFALLDLALRGRTSAFVARLRLYSPFALVALAYALVRARLLDNPMGEAHMLPTDDPLLWLERMASKVVASLAPAGGSLPWAFGLALAWLVAGGLALGVARRWIAAGVTWWLLTLLTAMWHHVSRSMGGSRTLIAALVGCWIMVCAAIASRAAPRWFRAVAALLFGLALVDLVGGTRSRQADYQLAWRQMASLREQFATAVEGAVVERPLVLLASSFRSRDMPFLEATSAFALAEPPLARTEHAFVSLGLLVHGGVGPDMMEFQLGPWRAMWRQGATLCYWNDLESTLVVVPRYGTLAPPRWLAGPSGFTAADGPAPPWTIGGLEVIAASSFTGGDLVWRTGAGQAGHVRLGAASRTDAGWSSVADFEYDALFLGLGGLQGIHTVELLLEGAVAVRELRTVAPLEPAALRRPLRGAVVAIGELATRLPLDSVPAGAEPGSIGAVLMNKACAFRATFAAGETVLSPRARVELVELDRFVRRDRVYYYLECRVAGRPWRSEVDWFERVRGQ